MLQVCPAGHWCTSITSQGKDGCTLELSPLCIRNGELEARILYAGRCASRAAAACLTRGLSPEYRLPPAHRLPRHDQGRLSGALQSHRNHPGAILKIKSQTVYPTAASRPASICVCIYIYICISIPFRCLVQTKLTAWSPLEREREICIHTYIYIYVYTVTPPRTNLRALYPQITVFRAPSTFS